MLSDFNSGRRGGSIADGGPGTALLNKVRFSVISQHQGEEGWDTTGSKAVLMFTLRFDMRAEGARPSELYAAAIDMHVG